jgi:hypothetical protein
MAQLEKKNKHVEPLQAKASSVDESMATATSALSLDGNSRARRRTRRNEEKDPNKDPATKNLDGTARVEGAETTNTFRCKFHPGDVVSMDEGVGVGVKKVNISIFLHRITKASCVYLYVLTRHTVLDMLRPTRIRKTLRRLQYPQPTADPPLRPQIPTPIPQHTS